MALDQLPATTRPVTAEQVAQLRRYLGAIPDPRQRRGRRHPATAVLCAAAAAVLSGARSLAAIGEWIADAPSHTLAACGFPADPLTR